MTANPEMSERVQALFAAAREAQEHARLCSWPGCDCESDEPGRVRCSTTGSTIHFMHRIDSETS